jgi:HlyD family secretion protein
MNNKDNKKSGFKKVIITTIVILVFVGLVFTLAKLMRKPREVKEERQIPIKLSAAQMGDVERYITVTGTLNARNKIDIFSRISGRVLSVYFEEGQHVNAGDIVVQLDPRETEAQLNQTRAALRMAQAQLAQAQSGHEVTASTTGIQVDIVRQGIEQAEQGVTQAKSSYNNAKVEFDRAQNLYTSGAIAKQALDQAATQYEIAQSRLEAARAQVKQAQENLRLAQAGTGQAKVSQSQIETASAGVQQARANVQYLEVMLSNTQLRSTISGTVTLRSVEPGALVAPGDKTPPIAVVDNSVLYLEGDIPQSEAGGINKGEKVNVRVDATGKVHTGEIETIIAAANPASRTFRVKINLPNPAGELRDGMSAAATMRTAVYSGVVIPREWLKTIEGEFYVVKVNDEMKAHHQKVKLGYYNEEKALVLEGVTAGEKIISAGQNIVKDGNRVLIVE